MDKHCQSFLANMNKYCESCLAHPMIQKFMIISGSMAEIQAMLISKSKDDKFYFFLLCVDIILRGISEVFLCNNPVTGFLICMGLACTSGYLMGYAILGTIFSTLAAIYIGRSPTDDIFAGLCGYDGALVGCACNVFIASRPQKLGAAIMLSAAAGVLHVSMSNFLALWKLPSFTLSFNIVTALYMLAAVSGAVDVPLATSAPEYPAADFTKMSIGFVLDATFRGVGQFMFANTTGGSFLVIMGIFIASPISCAMAIVGSVIGWFTSYYVLSLPSSAIPGIRNGLYGYNSMGVCVVMAGEVFFTVNPGAVLMGMYSAGLAAFFTIGIKGMLDGISYLTMPFIVTSWCILLLKSDFLVPLSRKVDNEDEGIEEVDLKPVSSPLFPGNDSSDVVVDNGVPSNNSYAKVDTNTVTNPML